MSKPAITFARTVGHCSSCERGRKRPVVVVKISGKVNNVTTGEFWTCWWAFCLVCCERIGETAQS